MLLNVFFALFFVISEVACVFSCIKSLGGNNLLSICLISQKLMLAISQ